MAGIFGTNLYVHCIMKKYYYFMAVATMLFAGCTKEQEVETNNSKAEYSLYASLYDVKTTYTVGDSDGFQWALGEKISVGTENGYQEFECTDAETGRFTGSYAPAGVAVSPVQTAGFTSAESYSVSFPAEYSDYVSGTTNALLIGVPEGDNGSYYFYNAGALIQVTYENVPAGVKKFVMTTGKNISGTVTLSAVPSSDNPVEISSEDLDEADDAGKTVTVTLNESPSSGSSLSIFIPVPTGNLGSLQIGLQDSNGNYIEGSKKALTKDLVLQRKQVLSLPVIELVSTTTIGAADNTTGWWGAHSDYYRIEKGKRLHLKYLNYTKEYDNDWRIWTNWVLVLSNEERGAEGYSEYLVARTDRYGWGNKYVADNDYLYRYSNSTLPDDATLREEINGATVDLTIDFNGATIFVLATMTKGDVVYTKHLFISGFESIPSVLAFLTVDNSHIELLNAYYDNTRGNVRPHSLSVSGLPESIVQNISMAKLIADGNDIKAQVTWPDGTTTYVDRNDVSLSGHDTPGEGVSLTATYGKKIYGNDVEGAAYNKTFTKSVTVTEDYVESIEAGINAIVYGASDLVSLSQESALVTANWASGGSSRLDSDDYSIAYTGGYWGSTFVAEDKENVATVTYTGSSYSGEAPTCTANLTVETSEITADGFGGANTAFAWNYEEPWIVKDGHTATFAMTATCTTEEFLNWKTPQIYIKNQDQSLELYRARMDFAVAYIPDNWAWYYWGSDYVNGGNINWSLYNAANLNNAKIYMSIDNNNGFAWITMFWQYYTDSTRETLIDGDNTVFVNYGKLPITAGESIYIIPASEYCGVSFIK